MKLIELSLRWKIFFGLFSLSVLMGGALYLFIKFSFISEFHRYIEQKDVNRSQKLIEALQRDVFDQNIETLFSGDRKLWNAYIVRYAKSPSQGGAKSKGFTSAPKDHGPNSVPPFFAMSLYDDQKNFIIGNDDLGMEIHFEPIYRREKIVGYLGIPLNPALTGVLEEEFIGDFTGSLLIATGFSLLMAFLVSIPISSLMSRRLQVLAEKLEGMAGGDYESVNMPLSRKDEFGLLEMRIWELSKSLQEAESSRQELVANISHDLRTPLAVLKADLEALQDGIREWGHESLGRLVKHSDRLHKLISDLYELSLTQLGNLRYRKEMIDLNSLVENCVTDYREWAIQKGISLTVELSFEQEIWVYADAGRVEQLLGNLISNSLQYSDSPGSVQVSVTSDSQAARISVEDSAPSLPQDDFSKLFVRSYRGHRQIQDKGSGLGLLICKNIVDAHGGSIFAQRSVAGGVAIIMLIPKVKGV